MTTKQRIELEVRKAQVALQMRELLEGFLEEAKQANPKIKASELADIEQWVCETVFPDGEE